jgi:hypothetical protein
MAACPVALPAALPLRVVVARPAELVAVAFELPAAEPRRAVLPAVEPQPVAASPELVPVRVTALPPLGTAAVEPLLQVAVVLLAAV